MYYVKIRLHLGGEGKNGGTPHFRTLRADWCQKHKAGATKLQGMRKCVERPMTERTLNSSYLLYHTQGSISPSFFVLLHHSAKVVNDITVHSQCHDTQVKTYYLMSDLSD